MAGTHKKGTNDADGDGAKGGSLPGTLEGRVAKLEKQHARMLELMRRNGWSVED